MKKTEKNVKKSMAVLAAVACVTATACALASCKTEISTPANLALSDRTLTWDAVDGATKYVVEVNGKEYETNETAFVLEDYTYGYTTMRVKALSKKTSSEYSALLEESVVWTLDTPQGLVQDGMLVRWDEVQLAQGYIVSVNGIQYGAEETFYECDEPLSVLKVMACGNAEGTLRNSAFSSELTIKPILAAPVISYDSGAIVWDAVDGATGYTIFKNGEEYASVQTNEYTIPQELVIQPSTFLQVRAESEMHLSSALSNSIDVGQNSEANPVLVSTLAEFAAMSQTGHYKLGGDLDFAAYDAEMQMQCFKGTLDGNGYAISNLKVALFNVLDGAKVQNVCVKNAAIEATLSESGKSVGVLANRAIGATLEACELQATLFVTSKNGVGYVGGAIGVSEYSTLKEVSFAGSVTTNYCTTGGLIGKAYNAAQASEITACSIKATIELVGGETTYCGGLIGQFTDNYLTVKESETEVNIRTNAAYCGGFVGYMGTGKIQDCLASGTIENTNVSIAHVGGFIGRTEGYNVAITRCISMTSILAQSGENIFVGGFVGKTVGGTYANVYSNCFYDNTLAAIDRIGNSNGKGDGITAKSTAELKDLSYQNGYDENVWTLGKGELPSLMAVDAANA